MKNWLQATDDVGKAVAILRKKKQINRGKEAVYATRELASGHVATGNVDASIVIFTVAVFVSSVWTEQMIQFLQPSLDLVELGLYLLFASTEALCFILKCPSVDAAAVIFRLSALLAKQGDLASSNVWPQQPTVFCDIQLVLVEKGDLIRRSI